MAAGTFTKMYEVAHNLIAAAGSFGFAVGKPVRLTIQGYAAQEESLAKRVVNVSYEMPTAPRHGVELWCDPKTLHVYKSNLSDGLWYLVHQRDDMLYDGGDVQTTAYSEQL